MKTTNLSIRRSKTAVVVICFILTATLFSLLLAFNADAASVSYRGYASYGTEYYVSLSSTQASYCFDFIAPYTGTYRIRSYSRSGLDPYVRLGMQNQWPTTALYLESYGRGPDASAGTFAYNDDGNGDLNFLLDVHLNANEHYVIWASKYGADTSGGYYMMIDWQGYYGVSLNDNGGSGGSGAVYGGYLTPQNGEHYSLGAYSYETNYVNVPSKTGYHFLGYYTNTSGGTQVIDSSGYIKASTLDDYGNCTVYARWGANNYYFNYYGNGATSGSMGGQTFTYNTAQLMTPNAFVRTGYTFLGWSRSSTATTATYGNQGNVYNYSSGNGSTYSWYAVWSPNTYNVAYNANGGTGSMENTSHTYNTSAYLRANSFTRAGYTFLGWSASSTATSTTYSDRAWVSNLAASGTKTLYAVWSPNSYSVTLNNQSGTGGSSASRATFDGALPTVTVPTKTGYTFGGYYTEVNGGGTKYYNADGSSANNYGIVGNTTLFAKWTANTYPITVDLKDGELTETAPTSATYGAPITLTVPSKENYLFRGWKITGASTGAYYKVNRMMRAIVPGEDTPLENQQTIGFEEIGSGTLELYNLTTGSTPMTIEALWEENAFDVAFLDNDGSVLQALHTYEYGDAVTVPSSPAKADDATYHYVFKGWLCSADGVIYTDLAGLTAGGYLTGGTYDVTYTAVYDVTYLKEIHLEGIGNNMIVAHDSTGTTVSTQFRITRNTGVNSLLLLLDYDKTAFNFDSIVVTDENGDNISDVLGFKWTLTGSGIPNDGNQYLLLEGLNNTAPYFSTATSDEVFITINYTSIGQAQGGLYTFGFRTEYPEDTSTPLSGDPRSEAYYVYAVNGDRSEQGEVKITVDSSRIRITVRQVGVITIAADQHKTFDGEAITASDIQALLRGEVLYAYNGFGIETTAILTVKWYDAEGNELQKAPSAAGTYQIGVSATNGTYFTAVDEVKQTFCIDPYGLVYTDTDVTGVDKVYNANEQSWVASELTLPEHTSVESITGAWTNVGEYTLTVVLRADTNYALNGTNGDTGSFNVTVHITKATNEWTTDPEGDYDKTYDSTGISVTPVAKFGDAAKILVFSTDGVSWSATNPADAGDYFFKVTVADTDNYSGLEAIVAYTITKQVLDKGEYATEAEWLAALLSGNSKVYSANVQIWEITDFSGKPDFTEITDVLAIEGQDYINVGTPDVTVALRITNANYCFAGNTETTTVTKAVAITPFAVTVTASNQSAVYSGEEPVAYNQQGESLGTIAQLYTVSVPGGELPAFAASADFDVTVTKAAGVTVGQYPITITASNRNYIITKVNGTFTITKQVVIVPTISSFTYDKTGKIPTAPVGALYSYTVTEQTNAGTYGITVTLTDAANYMWSSVTTTNGAYSESVQYYEADDNGYYKVRITGFAENAVYYTFTGSSMEYVKASDYNGGTTYYTRTGDTEPYTYAPVASITSVDITGEYVEVTGDFSADTVYYTHGENGYVRAEGLEVFAEGTTYYTFTEPTGDYYEYKSVDRYGVVGRTTENNVETAAVSLDWTILPARISVAIDNKTSQYSDAIVALTGVISGTVYAGDELGITYGTTATNASAVGDYPITGDWNDNTNYEVTFENGTYTVTQKIIGGGTAEEPDFSDIIPAIGSGSGKYYTGSTVVWTLADFIKSLDTITLNSVAAQEGVEYIHVRTDGSKYYYDVTVGLADSTNYSFINNAATQVLPVEVVILKANNSWTTQPNVSAPNVGNVSQSAAAAFGDDTIVIYDNEECTTVHTGAYNADTAYYAKFTVIGTTDYTELETIIPFTVGFYSIAKPTVQYNGADVENFLKAIIYDGYAHSFTIPESDGYTITLTTGEWKNVGDYTATVELNDNYGWGNNDYGDIVYTLTISRKTLEITAENKTVVYLDAVPTYTVSTDAFAAEENFGTFDITIADYLTCAYAVGSGFGTQTIGFTANAETTLEGIMTNYDVSLVDGTLTIDRFTFSDAEGAYRFAPVFGDSTVEYDSARYSIAVTGTAPANISVAYTVNGNAFPGAEDVGTYVITATYTVTGDDAANFNTPAAQTATLRITALGITVTAQNQTAVYTGSEPTTDQSKYTFGFTDGREGTPGEFVSAELTVTLTKAAGVNVGDYDITVSPITNGNYALTYVKGTYTITKAQNEWTTELWTLDDTGDLIFDGRGLSKGIDYGATALWGNNTAVFTFYKSDKTLLVGTPGQAGTYYITVEVPEAANWTGLKAGFEGELPVKQFVIQKATYDISGIGFADVTVTYDAENHTIAITGTLPNGVTVAYSPANTQKNQGIYEITADFGVSDSVNYNVPESKSATLTINKAPITLTADAKSSQYYQDIVALTYKVTSGTNYNGEIVPSLTTTATNRSVVGEYPITVTAANDNYTITLENGIYTIAQAATNTVTATASDSIYLDELVYGSASTFGERAYTFSTDGIEYNATLPKNVDHYWVKATVAETANYVGGEATAEFDITKATLNNVVFSYRNGTASWNAVTLTNTAKTVDCEVTYTVDGVANDTLRIAAAKTGTYTVAAVPSDTHNYNGSSTATVAVYSVTFDDTATDPAHNAPENMPETQYIFAGQTAVTPQSTPTTEGFDFANWKLGENGEQYYFSEAVNANTALFAVWTVKRFTVIWDVDGDPDTTEDRVEQSYTYKAIPVFPNETPEKATTAQYSYEFIGWNPLLAAITQDITFVAQYTETAIGYTVTYYIKNDSDSYIVYRESATVPFGTALTHPTIDGMIWFRADAWYTDSDRTEAAPETMPAGNLNCYGAYVFDIGLGDVNASGTVTTDDITTYRQKTVGGYNIVIIEAGTEFAYIRGGNFNAEADYYLERVDDTNRDGKSDIRDISTIRMALVGGHGYAVVNEDGGITGQEIGEVEVAPQASYTATVMETAENLEATVSGNTVTVTSSQAVASGSVITLNVKSPNYYLLSENTAAIRVNGSAITATDIIGNSYTVNIAITEANATFRTVTIDWDGDGTAFEPVTYTIDTAGCTLG